MRQTGPTHPRLLMMKAKKTTRRIASRETMLSLLTRMSRKTKYVKSPALPQLGITNMA
jgi:hypothetical protein